MRKHIPLFIGIALTVACASFAAPSAPVPVPTHVAIDSAVASTLAMVHHRLMGHPDYPDHEWVWCLRGVVRNDTAYVLDIGTTAITGIHAGGARYRDCPSRDYLGTAHNHPPSLSGLFYSDARRDGCYFSTTDMDTFAKDERAVISVVTCGNGRIIARGR